MEFPSNDDEMRAHMDRCEGCHLINKGRTSLTEWLPCYEHQQRNVAAIKKIMELYSYDKDKINGGYPSVPGPDGMPVVNLLSLVDDLTSRYERGSLVAGEHRR